MRITPGHYLTRAGKEVYIACRLGVNAGGSRNTYLWWVEDGKRGWSVDEAGRHLKHGSSVYDIVAESNSDKHFSAIERTHDIGGVA